MSDILQTPNRVTRRRSKQPSIKSPIKTDTTTPKYKFNALSYDDNNNYGNIDWDGMQQVGRGRRPDKTWETVNQHLTDKQYEYPTYDSFHQLSQFNQYLTDMLINGNYRIKFTPKCSTRASATEFCRRKLDDKGRPIYRLLPPNTTDFFGRPICDLNGDKVDDIVIVNKQGIPCIINGYRLVKADPYKKIWNELKASGNTNLEFNDWLNAQFEVNKDWKNYDEKDWDRGKINYDINTANINESIRKTYNYYRDRGIGKPRLNTRINARSLFSSMFGGIWKAAMFYLFEVFRPEGRDIKSSLNYMKFANAVYIIQYEDEVRKAHGKDWIAWTNYKADKSNAKTINAEIGQKVVNDYQVLEHEITDYSNDPDRDQADAIDKYGKLKTFINKITEIIQSVFRIDFSNSKSVKSLNNYVLENPAQCKDYFKKNIDVYIGNKVGNGYTEMLNQRADHKPKYNDKFDIKYDHTNDENWKENKTWFNEFRNVDDIE